MCPFWHAKAYQVVEQAGRIAQILGIWNGESELAPHVLQILIQAAADMLVEQALAGVPGLPVFCHRLSCIICCCVCAILCWLGASCHVSVITAVTGSLPCILPSQLLCILQANGLLSPCKMKNTAVMPCRRTAASIAACQSVGCSRICQHPSSSLCYCRRFCR